MAKVKVSAPAAQPAKEEGNKSVPASAPALTGSTDVRKWALRVIIALAIVTGIARIASIARSGHEKKQVAVAAVSVPATTSCDLHSQIPLVCWPQSSWPKLVMSAGGKSQHIPVPPGMRIVMAGNKFLNHTIYQDGNECAFNDKSPCPNGAVTGNYATNESLETNIVSYAFEPVS